jgi:aromatase
MVHTTEHTIDIDAPAETVHGLLADVTAWPRLFEPSVHIEVIERDGDQERIQIWAQANGETKTWVSKRVLSTTSIAFRQEVPSPPVASMGGEWIVEAVSQTSCRVRLLHDFTAVGDESDWILRAVNSNSIKELEGLRRAIQRPQELLLTFEDTVDIAGSVKDVYDFLNEAGHWRERLPHVAAVELTEDTPGIQLLKMDTRTADGSTHTTESVRICRPPYGIYYKQLGLPALLNMHVGYWRLEETDDGVRATAGHSVEIRREAITEILGSQAGPADVRAFLRKALGGNSTTTLRHARDYAERRG